MITDPPPTPPSPITLALEAPARVRATALAAAAPVAAPTTPAASTPADQQPSAAAAAATEASDAGGPSAAAMATAPSAATGSTAEVAAPAGPAAGPMQGREALAAAESAAEGEAATGSADAAIMLDTGGRSHAGPTGPYPSASGQRQPPVNPGHPARGDGREVGPVGQAAGPGPLGSAAAARPPAPSLQECCCKVIERNLSIYNCLELLAMGRGLEVPGFASVAAASLRFVVNSFETLQGMRSEEELRAALPPDLYDSLVSAQRERLQAVAAMRRVGRVVERAAPLVAASEAPSAAGRPVSYPAEALMRGVVWPPEVDGTAREEWLSPQDFGRLFGGLSWEDYCRLPGWKRTRLKQEAGLF